jgi:hypothetical protein
MSAVGRSVQFRGIENVIQAYESNDVAPWALFQGSQLLAKCEGVDLESNKELLSQLLNRLNNDDNIATYTLCVYDDLKTGEKIKNNTKYDGSFNFKLNDTMNDYKAQRQNGIGQISERLAAIEARLEKNNEGIENEPEEKEFSPWGAIGKLIDHPDVQRAIAGKFVAILDGLTNLLPGKGAPFLSPSYPAQIGSVAKSLSPDQTAKLNQALQYLSEVDPQLGDHLLAIGIIAKHDPNKYAQLIGMINLL